MDDTIPIRGIEDVGRKDATEKWNNGMVLDYPVFMASISGFPSRAVIRFTILSSSIIFGETVSIVRSWLSWTLLKNSC